MKLVLAPNLPDPDAVYELILSAHEGLSEDESAALNARLILILCNHIGDPTTVEEALAAARPG